MKLRLDPLKALATICLLSLVVKTRADIVLENDLIVADEIFDLKYALDSAVDWNSPNTTKYYCVFRSLWTPDDHPNEFPELARMSSPAVFSHTKQYAPFLKNRDANYGVEVIAESGFTDKFQESFRQEGEIAYDYSEGNSFFVNKKKYAKNFRYIPAIKVDKEHRYMSGISGIKPSPDWFTGFYHFDTIDEYDRVFWDSFKVQTYPWDAGTDDGQHYNDIDYEKERPDVVKRMTPGTAPNGVFVSPFGDEIRPVGEWECVLHTCTVEDPDCEKPDWPPANGCDILRFPECGTTCDPKVDEPCERCIREEIVDPEEVWYKDCCAAGRRPKRRGRTCESGAKEIMGAIVAVVLSVVVAMVV